MDFTHYYPTCTTVHILATLYPISLFLANMDYSHYYISYNHYWILLSTKAYCCKLLSGRVFFTST
ncbi:hypothetical protein BDR05DRAFT_390486 [Suillus weaverae]|nr:hypothetical protein BDR05DRAFT_390486 [Suillus weaverae]